MEQAFVDAGLCISSDVSIDPIDATGVLIDRIGPCGMDSRYHANIRGDFTPAQIAALPTFTPLPVTPYRVFFD
jgi:hypothetical protein